MIEKARAVEVRKNLAKLEISRVSACGESCGSCKGGCAPTNTFVNAVKKH